MRLLFTTIGISAMLLAGCSSNYAQTRSATVIATIHSTEKAPVVCEQKDKSSVLLSGIIGGLIGNQFGSGSGRDWATAGGAVIGAATAANKNKNNRHNQRCRSDGWISHVTYVNPYTNQLERSRIKTDYAQDVGTKVRTTINVALPPTNH